MVGVATIPCVAFAVSFLVVEFCARIIDGGSVVAFIFCSIWDMAVQEFV